MHLGLTSSTIDRTFSLLLAELQLTNARADTRSLSRFTQLFLKLSEFFLSTNNQNGFPGSAGRPAGRPAERRQSLLQL